MPGSEFIIKELDVRGGNPPANGAKYAEFRWTAKNKNIPYRPWSFSVAQRTVRTDYPGADDPTEQVLGPNFEPFELAGKWDDRYNPLIEDGTPSTDANGRVVSYVDPRGYAVQTWKAFEEMVRRGNPVNITFEEVVIEGIITNFEVEYRHASDIGYRFTFSPHHRQPGGFFALQRSPRSALNATQLRNEVNEEIEAALAIHEIAPDEYMIGTLYLDAQTHLNTWSQGIVEIDAAIELRQLSPELEPNASLLRLASQFYTLTTTAIELIDLLRGYDSSEVLGYTSLAESTMDFDTWSRGLMFYARRVITTGRRAASDLQQRAEPNALALYTPQAGESLYAVSNRFYKTPFNWRLIAERNRLSTFTLDGTELLIIPEVAQR